MCDQETPRNLDETPRSLSKSEKTSGGSMAQASSSSDVLPPPGAITRGYGELQRVAASRDRQRQSAAKAKQQLETLKSEATLAAQQAATNLMAANEHVEMLQVKLNEALEDCQTVRRHVQEVCYRKQREGRWW